MGIVAAGFCLVCFFASSGALPLFSGTDGDAKQLMRLRKEANALIPRINAGGRTAKTALARLISLVDEPDAKTVMRVAGAVEAAVKLMKRPSTTDDVQRLAGSVVTLMTNMPVTSEISDDRTGSSGHVHVVLPRPSRIYAPDQAVFDLAAGVRPELMVGGHH